MTPEQVEILRAKESLVNSLRTKLTAAQVAVEDCARGEALTPDGALTVYTKLHECFVELMHDDSREAPYRAED